MKNPEHSLTAEQIAALHDGLVIPAHPLALDENRSWMSGISGH